MANIKFSQFLAEADIADFDALVGYEGLNNVRISPADLATSLTNLQGGPFLPLVAGAANPITGDSLYIGDGTPITSTLVLNNDPLVALSESKIVMTGNDFVKFNSGTNIFTIGTNSEIRWNETGSIGVEFGGAPNRFVTETAIESDLLDTSGGTGGPGFILKSNGGGLTGVSWKQEQPGCQIKIVGAAGLGNTNNGTDFLVPYNTVVVNDDATIFNPVVTGGLGNQGAIQVLQDGRYEFFARYSSFDLAQTSLPTLDGTKFFRITAATDTVSGGIGTKQCILQDLVVATSVNGEANVTGGGFMDLSAGDYFKIIGFHNGATGGTGTQGFPVNSNAFFNEPMLWLVKIQ